MRIFKRITTFALAAVTAGAMGLGAAAEVEENFDEEYAGGYTLEERENWGIDDYAENIKTVFKMTYPDEEDVIDDIVDAITESDVFAELFEEDAREAFQIVEDSLRDALEPSAMPLDGNDESDFSQYSVSLVKQSAATDIDSAAAAATMALMGRGASGYNQNSNSAVKSKLNSDISTNIMIHKITNLLQESYENDVNKNDSVSNYAFRTMAFTPRNNAVSKEGDLINCLSYALAYDTVPVIRVDKTSLLPYYNTDMNYPLYFAVTEVDNQAECIRFYDPNNNAAYSGKHYLDFTAVRDLLVGSKVLWVSAFASDKRLIGLEGVKNVYPDGSYFTKNGEACNIHKGTKTCENCICFDNSWQCAGFARLVYYCVRGVTPNDAGRIWCSNKFMTNDATKELLQNLPLGTYVRVHTNSYYYDNGNRVQGQHSFALINANSSGITIYHANWGYQCGVSYETLSWTKFAEEFSDIIYYID